jgi:hypothetical protein
MSLKSQTRTNLASHESQDPHPDCMKVKTRINIKVMRIRTRMRRSFCATKICLEHESVNVHIGVAAEVVLPLANLTLI